MSLSYVVTASMFTRCSDGQRNDLSSAPISDPTPVPLCGTKLDLIVNDVEVPFCDLSVRFL